jgi:hypothetical protein
MQARRLVAGLEYCIDWTLLHVCYIATILLDYRLPFPMTAGFIMFVVPLPYLYWLYSWLYRPLIPSTRTGAPFSNQLLVNL